MAAEVFHHQWERNQAPVTAAGGADVTDAFPYYPRAPLWALTALQCGRACLVAPSRSIYESGLTLAFPVGVPINETLLSTSCRALPTHAGVSRWRPYQ